jgi:hypothetical protein
MGKDDTISQRNRWKKTRPETKRQKAIKSGNKLAAICRIRSQRFAASCRNLPLHLTRFHRNLTFTCSLPRFSLTGLFCPVMTDTAQPKRGGKPFQSILEPHFDFIHQQRQRRKTWQEIANLLFSEKGIRVTFYAPYRFYRRRLKRAAKPNWENSAGEIQPVNPAIQPPSRPAPLPKQNTFNRPNIKNINTDQEFT